MILSNYTNSLIILSITASLFGCYVEAEVDQSLTNEEIETVQIAALDSDESGLLDQYDSISTILPLSEIDVSKSDALMVSQTALNNIEPSGDVARLTKSFTDEKVLVVLEPFTKDTLVESTSGSYTSTLRFTDVSSVVAKTVTSMDGKAVNGVIMSLPKVSNTTPADDILQSLQQIEGAKRNPRYNSLQRDSIVFSIAANLCPYGQYLEFIEVDRQESLSDQSAEYWVLQLSQLAKAGTNATDCEQSSYKLDSIHSTVRSNSTSNRIIDYSPTTGKGDQAANLSKDYSWIVGTPSTDVVDKSNPFEAVEWLFRFPGLDDGTDQYVSLTQPGLLGSSPINRVVKLDRLIQIGFKEDRRTTPDIRKEFSLGWQISIKAED